MLLVDKPVGVSSHDVVSAARRALGESRVGHTGTLDPFATGLLILLVGRATRLAQFVADEPKMYDAVLRFGSETDTEDLDGTVVREATAPAMATLQSAIARHVGTMEQVPPAFSAKRIGGQRAYALARVGAPVDLKPVTVTIHSIVLLDAVETDGVVLEATIRVSCAGGTYVRSLARDIGRDCGSAAHLVALRRLSAGEFRADSALSLANIGDAPRALAPPLVALAGHAQQLLTAEEAALVVRGIDVEARVDGAHAALVLSAADNPAPFLVAFAERRPSERGDRWQPRVVMRDPQ